MSLDRYIYLAEKLLEEVCAWGTTILAVTSPEGLKAAQILKAENRDSDECSFDEIVWWDRLHKNRIVAQIEATFYPVGGSSFDEIFNSTGEYVGGLLQGALGKDGRLIVQVKNEVRTTMKAYRWLNEDGGDDVQKLEIVQGGAHYLVEIPVTESDKEMLRQIEESPAIQVPLILGSRPQHFPVEALRDAPSDGEILRYLRENKQEAFARSMGRLKTLNETSGASFSGSALEEMAEVGMAVTEHTLACKECSTLGFDASRCPELTRFKNLLEDIAVLEENRPGGGSLGQRH